MPGAAWLLLVTVLAHACRAGSSDADMTWEEYKVKFKKSYASPEEDERHRQHFLASQRHVVQHNERYERGEVSYSLGLSQFSDRDRSGSGREKTTAGDLERASTVET